MGFPKDTIKRFFACANCQFSEVHLGVPGCAKVNKAIDFADDKFCEINRWGSLFMLGYTNVNYDKERHLLWIERKDVVVEQKLDMKYKRTAPGELQWDPGSVSWTDMVSDAVRSIGSTVVKGPASPETVALRRKSCFGDPETRQPRCSALETTPSGSYCAACSCGKTPIADMTGEFLPKLIHNTLNCPRMMPGFSNAPSKLVVRKKEST